MTNYADHLRDDAFVIFLLHGIVRRQIHPVRNYTRKHLPLDEFASLLRNLCRQGVPVSMNDIMLASRDEPLPPRAFAITFDDGFENNASIAAPVLDDFGIPATFYITTGFIEDGNRSWTDIIEAAVEAVPTVKIQDISKTIDGIYGTPTQKHAMLEEVRRYVKGNAGIDPYDFAAEIVRQCGLSEAPFDAELDDKLSWNQVHELTQHPLFTVGGHSHTHRIMSFLPPDELEREVETSLKLLRNVSGKQLNHYSYPEGLKYCYSDAVIHTLKRHGIRCCPTAEHGLNLVGDDLFRLRRIFVI
jgi:peptidoglycan/xylan/chitin deacetylase (PgdA/CDA1 family)